MRTCALPECSRPFPGRVNQRYCCPEHRAANARCPDCGAPTKPGGQAPGKEGGGRRCAPCGRIAENARTLAKYGLTPTAYDELLAAQTNVCAICRGPETAAATNGGVRRLVVDHDHDSGRVRGLLCSRCNVAIGMFDDDVSRLAAAISYLKAHA